MFITPQSHNFLLCGHWLYNTKKHKLNREVLNIQMELYRFERTFKTVKTLIRTAMDEDQEEILEDSRNCFATRLYSIYITTSTDIPDIPYEQNRNIILVTPFVPDFNQFNRPILSVSFKNYSLDIHNKYIVDPFNKQILHKLVNELDSFASISNIEHLRQNDYYFEKLPLLELMKNKEYEKVGRYVHDIILKQPYRLRLNAVLVDTGYTQKQYHFLDLILDDIEMFVTQNILTARLAILTYRLCLWSFQGNRLKIDKFYSHDLHLGNAINIDCNSLLYLSRDLDSKSLIEGYDLRSLEMKQINIAKQLIYSQCDRYNEIVDKEIIHTVTTLPYAMIDSLIE